MTTVDELMSLAPVEQHTQITQMLATVPTQHHGAFRTLAKEIRLNEDFQAFEVAGVLSIIVFLVTHMGAIVALLNALMSIPKIIEFLLDFAKLFSA